MIRANKARPYNSAARRFDLPAQGTRARAVIDRHCLRPQMRVIVRGSDALTHIDQVRDCSGGEATLERTPGRFHLLTGLRLDGDRYMSVRPLEDD